jgi:putative membrane protein
MNMLIKILLNSVAIYATAYLLTAVTLPDFVTALLVALVLGVINITVKPVVKFLTIPLNFLTLGLLGFIINGAFLYLVAYLVDGFAIESFWWAILASLLVTFMTTVLEMIIGNDE